MIVDWNLQTDTLADNMGYRREEVDQALAALHYHHIIQRHADWDDIYRTLDATSIVERDKIQHLHGWLQDRAEELGYPEDPRVIFDDPEFRERYAPAPIVEGSLIHRTGEDYFLGEDLQQPLWLEEGEGDPYWHDGTSRYDQHGQIHVPVTYGSLIHQAGDNYYLHGYGQVWREDGEGESYWHDGTNRYDHLGQIHTPVTAGSLIHQAGNNYYLHGHGQVWLEEGEGDPYWHDGTNRYNHLGELLTASSNAASAVDYAQLDPEVHQRVVVAAVEQFIADYPGMAAKHKLEDLHAIGAEIAQQKLAQRKNVLS